MNPQILLIEGEETQATSIQRILEPAGYEVVWATTLQDVIDFLNLAERPVVVSSLRFSQLDVFSLMRWLVVNRPQARLLVLSEDVAPPARANGALSFVSLRSLSRLRSLVSDALAGHLPAVSFADLIDVLSLLVLTKSTQRLHVVFDQQQGHLYIWQGQILHAQTDSQLGLAAFSEILGWTGGGVYELPWEAPPEQSLQAGEAEALLLGSRRTPEPSSEGLLSILEDAVEHSIKVEPAPELAPQEPTFPPISQDFVLPGAAAPQTPEWPAAAPEKIVEAIQEPNPPSAEILLASGELLADEPPVEPSAPDEPAPLEPTPNEPTSLESSEFAHGLDLSDEASEDDTPAPQAPVTPAEVMLSEPSDEALTAMPQDAPPTAPKPPTQAEQVRAIEQELARAMRDDASRAMQRYDAPSRGQSTQNILAQEVLLGSSPLAELLREPKPQPNPTPPRRRVEAVKPEDLSSSEMEEASVEDMGSIVVAAKEEEDQPTGEDVWAELSQEMEAATQHKPVAVAQPEASLEPSPFDPPGLAPRTNTIREAAPAAEVKPFLQTPSYRETPKQPKPTEHAAIEANFDITQTPPLGMRIPNKMLGHLQAYNIAPSTPAGGVPIVQPTPEELIADMRTPPMGTRIVTPPKTPALGFPILQPPVAPVPFVPPQNTPRSSQVLTNVPPQNTPRSSQALTNVPPQNTPRSSQVLTNVPPQNTPRSSQVLTNVPNSIPHALNSGAYPVQTARTPSGMYRAIPNTEAEGNMFADYLTPPFGVKLPKTPNAEQTPLAPTGSPLANAARSAHYEKLPAAVNGPIADLVPVLESVAREVPEFVATVAFETDSGMTLGGVTSRTDLDAEGGFAYYAEVLRLLRPAISLFDASFEELLVTSPKWYILVRPLREEFFLGLITTRRGNLGICRIVLKRAATQLLERLPTKENKAP